MYFLNSINELVSRKAHAYQISTMIRAIEPLLQPDVRARRGEFEVKQHNVSQMLRKIYMVKAVEYNKQFKESINKRPVSSVKCNAQPTSTGKKRREE